MRQRHDMVDIDPFDRVERHAGVQRRLRVLNNGNTSPPLDLRESSDTVIQRPAQDHTDDARAISGRRGAKERIDGGPRPVLLRPVAQMNASFFQQKVAIRRSDIDFAHFDLRAVFWLHGRQFSCLRENGWQMALAVDPGTDVKYHENRDVKDEHFGFSKEGGTLAEPRRFSPLGSPPLLLAPPAIVQHLKEWLADGSGRS